MFAEGFSPSGGETGTCRLVAKNRGDLSLLHVMGPKNITSSLLSQQQLGLSA